MPSCTHQTFAASYLQILLPRFIYVKKKSLLTVSSYLSHLNNKIKIEHGSSSRSGLSPLCFFQIKTLKREHPWSFLSKPQTPKADFRQREDITYLMSMKPLSLSAHFHVKKHLFLSLTISCHQKTPICVLQGSAPTQSHTLHQLCPIPH